MTKAFASSLSICAVAACLALTIPGAAAAAPPGPGAVKIAAPAFPGRLYGVVASTGDVWAVGLDGSGSLALNWNGTSWAEYHPTLPNGFLIGVAQSSARDVWAVGGTYWFSPVQTLAEHWNGRSWTRVGTPNPGGGGYFSTVTALSSRDVWAVGQIAPGGPGVVTTDEPLIEHWNGSRWSIQKVQDPAGGGALLGVQATSPSNAWAVGWTGPPSAASGHALIEHWNGRTWTRVAPPKRGPVRPAGGDRDNKRQRVGRRVHRGR